VPRWWAAEAVVIRQGCKEKSGASGTRGGNLSGSLIAQAIQRTQETEGCGAVSRGKPLDASVGAESFGQGAMKRLRSRGGALEPHPLETQLRWGRPTGLCASSGAQRRCTSTMCTKTGSSYPAVPRPWQARMGGVGDQASRVDLCCRPDGCDERTKSLG